MTWRRLLGAATVVVGSAAVAACLRAAFTGMRDVMLTDGGFCASGGPYVIARHCSSGDVRLLMVGILGGLVATAVYAGGSAALSGSASMAGFLAWTALFGALGYNFISLGTRSGQGSSSGWLVTGVIFWSLALGGLVPALAAVRAGLRSAGRPDPNLAEPRPLVRAVIPPGLAAQFSPASGLGGWPAGGPRPDALAGPDQRARASALASLATWFVSSLAGAGGGLLLGSALVTALR